MSVRSTGRAVTWAIKPSGVDYDKLTPDDMVIMDLEGNKVEGESNPSSDPATHIELCQGVSRISEAWCIPIPPGRQAGPRQARGIPCYGTTHADYMYGEIPCAECLTKEEIQDNYEKNTGLLIAETFRHYDYEAVPAVLCKNHGPFTWGKDGRQAVHNAVVLEEVAKIAGRCGNDQSEGGACPSGTPGQALLQETWKRRLLRTKEVILCSW